MHALFCLTLGLLILATSVLGQGAGQPSPKVKDAIGEVGIAIFDAPGKVEAFRIEAKAGAKENHIAGYKILSKGSDKVDKGFAKRLGTVMTEEKTYTGQSARCFTPGVAYRVTKNGGKETAEIIICFACTNHRVIVTDATGKVVKEGGGAFGPEIGPLLKLAKEAFPDDKEIQDLMEKK